MAIPKGLKIPRWQRRVGSSPTARTRQNKRSEARMSDEDDDLFGEDTDQAVEEFDRLTDILYARVTAFAEDEDVADEMLPLLLLRLSLTIRMMNYAESTAKPSAGGLKLDLDRFRRDADDLIREAKKGADQYIAVAREAIAAAAAEDDEG
jgi:hypothetical protein